MESGTKKPQSAAPAENETGHCVLLIADEVARGRDLAEELTAHVNAGPEDVDVFVVSPAIADTALDQELGNVDPALPEARERLDSIVSELRSVGFRVDGRVGDADPFNAIGDALAEVQADEIVVVAHVESQADYAEKGMWERLRTDYHQPVTELLVGSTADSDAPRLFDVRHAPAHERTREEEIRETRNFPPLKPRDMGGILVGLLGTLALGLIAVAAGTEADGELAGRSAAIVLIAIGAFLFNVAHIVGLLFFQSVRYTGIWERFMSHGSMGVTLVGLAAALVLWLA